MCSRLLWEIRPSSSRPLFGLIEPPDGRPIDVRETFGRPGFGTAFLRAIFFLWSFGSLILNLYVYPEENLFIFMGYLTVRRTGATYASGVERGGDRPPPSRPREG